MFKFFLEGPITYIGIIGLYQLNKSTVITVNEDSLEFEVANFDQNVPWAQQAEKKSLNVGYKKQTIFKKYIVI